MADDAQNAPGLPARFAAARTGGKTGGALTNRPRQLRVRAKLPRVTIASLRPRFTERLLRLLIVVVPTVILVVSNAVAIAYYGVIASDQFQSETRFTIRTSTPLSKTNRFGEVDGTPSAEISQDTQIVTSFILSPEAVAMLEKQVDLVGKYSRPEVDYLSRLNSKDAQEDRVDFWQKMVDAEIDPTSGIVTVKVRAFSAADAHEILTSIVASSERLINELNDRIWADVTKAAEIQVERATAELAAAREKVQDERNKTGILSVQSSFSSLSGLLTQVQGEKIALETKYRSNAKTLSPQAPQMLVLSRQIAAMERQVEDLRAQIASEAGPTDTLADASTTFATLELQQKVAEQKLTASISALEQLHVSSQQQLMYLEGFLAPTLPEAAEYPQRLLWIAIFFGGSLVVAGAALGSLLVARDYVT